MSLRRSFPPADRRHRQGGQIIVLFTLMLVGMLAMAALLYDGAQALVGRRQLQNAADAAAMAAANVIQSGTTHGCSVVAGPPPGTVRSDVRQAALDSLTTNLPGFDQSHATVSCPDSWNDFAVQVSLTTTSPTFFGGIVGMTGIGVGASATALNGEDGGTTFGVVELDNPYHPSWPNGDQGCPSVLFSGSNTIVFDGPMQVDSNCPAGGGGALSSNGNSASLTFNNGARAHLVGGYSPGPLTISPSPLTGEKYVGDPLAGIAPVPVSSLPVRQSSKLTLNSGSTVLQAGVYNGGIELKNKAVAYLQPGIYVLNGGGLSLDAQSSVFSIASNETSTDTSTWASDCQASNCGVLIYNTSGTSGMGQISVSAGADLEVRPYNSTNDGSGLHWSDYQNLLIWQDASQPPSSSYSQPAVSLSGGGTVNVSGTVYAPSAVVQMGGNSGGQGGSELDATLQFISWDLQFSGNIGFHFFYQQQSFAKPTDYGLVQ